ncbi:MAG: hypothetical protein MUQ32_03550, partial [Chloroflexi bacterium]|nr:hypothetical protein [Chloroflexota bacterium]
MIGAWAIFFGVPYLSGHLQQIAASVGFGDGLASNLTSRLEGSPGHQAVVFARLAITGMAWLLAAAGVLRRMVTGHWDVTAVALAVAPFPMFALQSYGGEMLLRITLFSLPFVALLTAFLVFPRRTPAGRPTILAVFILTLVLLGTFMLTRYGNERLETFTRDEVAAVDILYKEAPAGSLLLGVTGNIPWKSTRYEEYRYRPFGDATFFGEADQMLQVARDYGGPVYLIATRAQRASVEMVHGAPEGAFDAFVTELLATNRFQAIYRNPDAIVARYVPDRETP